MQAPRPSSSLYAQVRVTSQHRGPSQAIFISFFLLFCSPKIDCNRLYSTKRLPHKFALQKQVQCEAKKGRETEIKKTEEDHVWPATIY